MRPKRIVSLAICILLGVGCSACNSLQHLPWLTSSSQDANQLTRETQHGATSSDIRDNAPPSIDTAETADLPPEASALARYTEGIAGDGVLVALIQTTLGTISCELFEDKAPVTVANFVGLARGMKAWVDPVSHDAMAGFPFYDGVVFHRVIPNFMIQTGDRTGKGNGGPGYSIPDEFRADLRHDRPGILSMANHGPNTGGSQFFITEAATPHLDYMHTVFGQCQDLDVVNAIARVPSNAMNRPHQPPTIETIRFERRSDR